MIQLRSCKNPEKMESVLEALRTEAKNMKKCDDRGPTKGMENFEGGPRFGDIIEPSVTKEEQENVDENESLYSLPLRDRLVHHIATKDVVLKSQQRGEPDLTLEERKSITSTLLDQNPGQFLYRFGKHLKLEHLQYFSQFEGDTEVDFYLQETQKFLNPQTHQKIVRNRRYAALQKLRKSGDYFSEKEMRERDPLLYEELVAEHMSHEEKLESNAFTPAEENLSSFIFNMLDQSALKVRREKQVEQENCMVEEEEEDSEEEEDVEMMAVSDVGEKRLLKEEFYSSMYNRFLKGKDNDFDFSAVDNSEDYDLLEIKARDDEERYFDED